MSAILTWSARGRRAGVHASGVAVGASLMLCVALSRAAGPSRRVLAVGAGVAMPVGAGVAVARRRPPVVGPADGITLARTVLAGGCATLLVSRGRRRAWPVVALATPALLLDAADGAVARRTGTAGPAGARLDMESDAAFLVVLSAAAAPSVGPWALAVGGMRYAFVAGSAVRPAWRQPLRPSEFRRVVAALQGAALAVALAPVTPRRVARRGVAGALALLTVSFGRDVVDLERCAAARART